MSKSNLLTPKILLPLAALAVLAGGLALFNRQESAARWQSTDDAYVRADFTAVAPRVAGVIERVAVEDHQQVKAGELLVQIDDRDLRMAVADAEARVAGARAVVAGLRAQHGRQRSVIEQARAAVDADDAALALAVRNRERFGNLAQDGSGTVLAQQQADTQWQVQRATRAKDLAALQAAQSQLPILAAELDKAQADLTAGEVRLADAQLKLSYARVTSPIDGVVDQRGARTGGYARPGEPLLAVVPMNDLYIEANLRETQLAQVRPRQTVMLRVDALPGARFTAHVESVAPASNLSFSPVPPHNATGNFTKIVQRLPVRIRLEPGQARLSELRVGMSVRPDIDTGSVDAAR